ncbi:hypothetical protein MATL_G00216780 [Megalops atlanticus]|uniref:ATF7-interacting protein protein binding domain-containing protein n=1 Tax=Megalops atlanticus TaxID=7932 RepID=A0A9D3SXD5_MEGAT|nr:hypothetical protein MATL_G00216780 [Megalops atlanticus]
MDMDPVNLEDDAPSLDKMAAASSLFQCPVPPANTFSSSPSLSPSHTPESDQEVKEGFLMLCEEEESQGEKEEERGNEVKDERDGEKMEVDAEKEGEKEENAGITTKDAVVPSTSPAPPPGDAAEEEGCGAAPSTRKRAMTGDSDPAGHAQGGEEEGPGGPEGQSKRPRVEGGELEAHLELKISASPETRLKLEKVVQQLVAEQLRVWQLSVIDRSLQELRERVERIDCATKHQQTLNTLQAKIARLTKKFGAANQAKENARKPQEMLSSPSAAASTPNATTNTTPAYREDESAKAAVLLRTFDQSVPQIMVNKETRCPLCRVCYKNVNVHLEKTHKVTSSEERKLILAKASLRFKGRMDCPVEGCGKTGMARLKLHLINKHHLRDTEDYMKKAKLAAINERLKAFDPQWSPDEGEVSKVEDLQSRVAQLERRLQSLTGEQPLPGPATDEAPSPPSAFEQVLEDYTQYCCGLSREPEALDNASQQAARVREWLHFISSSHGTPSAKMRFLANVHLTGKWLEKLSQSNYSRLTMRAYIDAAVNFLTYLEEMSPPKVKLPAAARRTLCGIFRVAKEGLTPDITLSRQEQKAKKSDRILSREDMRTFLFAAKEKIPRLLAKLRRHPKNRDVFADTVGFLLGYMYMLTGHRKEVLINMTTKDFNQCKSDPRGVYLVSITWHKTSAKFGRASLLLRKDELEWFIKFSAVRSSLPGYGEKPKTFFFNSSGHPLNRVRDYIVKVWSSLHLPGTPTVTLIRSSLATLVSDLPENKRQQVARATCHDVATAERFYVAELDTQKSHESQNIAEQCLRASTPTHDAAEDSDDPGLGTSSQVYLPSARRKRRLVILDSDESSKEEEGKKCAKESRKDDAGFTDIQDAPCSPLHELAEDSDPGEGTSSMVGLSLLPKRPPEGVKRRIMAYPEDFQKLTRQVFSTYLVEDICQS